MHQHRRSAEERPRGGLCHHRDRGLTFDTADAKVIEITGEGDSDAFIGTPPEEIGRLNVKVDVQTGMGVREESRTYEPLEVSLADLEQVGRSHHSSSNDGTLLWASQ